MSSLQWTDADEIGFQLSEKLPHVDPLMVSFPDLRTYVLELEEFFGQPDTSSESLLEAIQMAWLDYYRDLEGLD